MSIRRRFLFVLLMIVTARTAAAQVFGSVRIVVRDQQNLAVADAEVTVKAKDSAWSQTAKSNEQGEALFITVPFGTYVVSVTSAGFDVFERDIQVISNTQTPVQVRLAVAGLAQSVDVKATAQTINPESSGTQTLTSREDILLQPLTDRSGSLAMITNNVPGTFVMHDHLHSRGGHGVTWQIDGVPVPNSNLASVGSQFDPKDVDSLEVNRGGLGTNYGDRAYGVFNVVPRSGFEDHKFADMSVTVGNYNLANGYLSLGDHTDDQKFAW